MFLQLINLRVAKFSNSDFNGITDFSNMFNGCSSLLTLEGLDTSDGIIFSGMFASCRTIADVSIDTSNGTDFTGMFTGAHRIQLTIDTSSGLNFTNMLSGVNRIHSIPAIDTSKGTSFTSMFKNCTKLKCITQLDTRAGMQSEDKREMFLNCDALTSPSLAEQTDLSDTDGALYINPYPCP